MAQLILSRLLGGILMSLMLAAYWRPSAWKGTDSAFHKLDAFVRSCWYVIDYLIVL
jgi:hypothetical protein